MPTNRLDQPKAEKRSELVQAACRLFLQDGFDRTSMSRIASEAGVTPNTIYWYFKDKDDLLLAVNDQFVQEYMKVYLADMVDKPLSEQLVWLVNQLKPFNGLITTVHNRIHSSEAVHKWNAGFHALMERLLIMQLPGAQPTDGFDADIQIISFTIEGMISHDLNQKDINKICQALTQRIGGV